MKDGTKRKGGKSRTLAGFLLLGVLLLLAVLVILYQCGIRAEDIFRPFSSADTAEELFYENGNRFAGIDGGLVVLSESQLQVIGQDGTNVYTETLLADRPALHACGGFAAAYDAGGNGFWVVGGDGLQYRAKTEQPVISVSVNAKGWAAVCTEDEGYDGRVTVYNSKGNEVYQWYSGSGYVVSAQVSPDGKKMAAAVITGSGCRVSVMELTRTEESAVFSLTDCVAMELAFTGRDTLGLLTDTGYYVIDAETGTEQAAYDLEGQYLQGCSFDGNGFFTVVSSHYQLGTESVITTISQQGEVLGQITVEGGILDISASGNYIAVLSTGKITVYNKDMSPCAEFEEMTAEQVAVRENGTVLAIGSYSARTCTP